MKRLLLLLIILPAIAFGQSYRKPPFDGYWWNPAEGGRGWSFETHDELVAITHYVYDQQRDATFLQTVGTWNPTSGTLNARLLAFTNGQCIGCSHRSPTSADIGSIEFTFTTQSRGQIRFPDNTVVPIERFEFGFPQANSKFLGSWATYWFSLSSDFTHYIYISAKCAACGTPDTYQGTTELIRGGRPVIVGSASGVNLALVDAGGSFYDYYYFIADTNRWSGLGCTAPRTSSAPAPTACSGLMYGSRDKGLQEARALFGLSRKGRHSTDSMVDAERAAVVATPASKREQLVAEIDQPGVAELMESLRRDMLRAE